MAGAEVEELGVFRGWADQGVALREGQVQLRLGCLIEPGQCRLEDPIGDQAHLLGGTYVARQGHGAGFLDNAMGIFLGEPDDAPHAALTYAAFGVKEPLAQCMGLRADGLGLGEQEGGLCAGSADLSRTWRATRRHCSELG